MKTEFNSFYDYMKSYDYDTLYAITEMGCISGCAGGMVYYTDTCALYDEFAHELHTKLGEWIDEIGETPEFITRELAYANGFKNAMVWFVAEQYANELTQTADCEPNDE